MVSEFDCMLMCFNYNVEHLVWVVWLWIAVTVMPGNKYNGTSSVPTSRIERLLRERELRKNSKSFYTNDGGNDAFEYGDNLLEQYLEGASAARDGWEKPDGGLFTQRLLVVANRLPVSAIRRGEESWSLEVSAGGLVSALLGKFSRYSFLKIFVICYAAHY